MSPLRCAPRRLIVLLALFLAIPTLAQVLDISLADNFDRPSLLALEASARTCAVMIASAYRKSSDGSGTFKLSPKTLQQIVRSVAMSGPKIYGSCIAFEPGIVQLGAFEGGRAGLEDAVFTSGRFTELALVNRNDHVGGKSIYSPYAYNCSSDSIGDDACSTIDLAWQYDYSAPGTTWFLEPRRLFLEAQAGRLAFAGRMFPAVWTEPYFDAGAGNINMTTFSVAFGTDHGEFLGVCTIDVAVESLCWTNCTPQASRARALRTALAMVRWFGAVRGPQAFSCATGSFMIDEGRCQECPPGSSSVGGSASACTQCARGSL